MALLAWLAACSLDERSVEVATLPNFNGVGEMGLAGMGSEPFDASVQASPPSEGVPPASASTLVAEPTSVDLGRLPVGASSAAVDWLISNPGLDDATGLALSTVGSDPSLVDFDVVDGCGQTLAAGARCTIQIVYRPREGGPNRKTLRLASSAGDVLLPVQALALPWLEIRTVGNGRVTSVPAGIDCGPTCRAPFEHTTEVELVATPAQGSRFSGWRGTDCDGPVGTCTLAVPPGRAAERTVEAAFFSPVNNIVFISSQAYPPTLGGVAPYDAACNDMARAAGINSPTGDGFIAAMSDSTSHVVERLRPGVRGWTRIDGRAFADTREEAVDLGIIYNPVVYTELGTRMLSYGHMSGTLEDGALGLHCDDWSSSSGELTEGNPFQYGPGRWMGNGTLPISGARPCDPDVLRVIVCLGNTATAPLVRAPRAGKRIWLSNTEFFAGGTTPEEKCQAERPPGVSNAVALIAHVGRPASELLDPEADYVRPDGELVASGAGLIRTSQGAEGAALDTGLWQSADGRYIRETLSRFAWSGSRSLDIPGTPESTCGDWRDASQRANVGNLGMTNFQFWSAGGLALCTGSGRVMCVEPAG